MMGTSKISLMVIRAIERAADLHANQKRKGNDQPYIVHPFSTFYILTRYTGDEVTLVSGLLHDVIEDILQSVYSGEDMEREFGEPVRRTVFGASEEKYPNDSPATKKATWLRRKKDHLEKLETEEERVLMVVCADRIHNLLSLIKDYLKRRGRMLEKV